jgi:tRNA-dihydrouridine synthase
MVARAALFDPQVFCDLTGKTREGKWEMFEKQAKWTGQVCDERFTTVFMRKMGAFYVKGTRGAAVFKDKFFSAQTPEEILSVANEAFQE